MNTQYAVSPVTFQTITATKVLFVWIFGVLFTGCQSTPPLDKGLVGHWPLSENFDDISGYGQNALSQGNLSIQNNSAVFNGLDAWLQVPMNTTLDASDYSISVRINAADASDDAPGDILSMYHSDSRQGFQLSLKTNYVTTSQANYRQLMFGIDDNYQSGWIDCGKPGNALLAFSMVDFQGNLYAGTCEPGVQEFGHVYRYEGDQKWIDCGSPDRSNSVMAMAEYENNLYAGTGHYRLGGSSLPDSENQNPGGQIFRYEGADRWISCGQLPDVTTIGGMAVYKGDLYASSLYSPGFFRYDGGTNWIDCGTPFGKRVVALAVFNEYLYATSYDNGNVYRYDGKTWEDCGPVGENTQTYSFIPYQGKLYTATWPSGRVYRFEGINRWKDVGRLGEELEVMGMVVQNGRFLGGTLPLAEVYSYEGDTTWIRIEQLDKTPDVRYRRAWTMAEHDGRVFCSTLPSGNIYAYESGKSVAWGKTFPSDWHHVVATKTDNRISLFVDGQRVSEKELPAGVDFRLSEEIPLQIGLGSNDFFKGQLKDLRLYNRNLSQEEINTLSHE